MKYGTEVILRGGRYFDYKRKGVVEPPFTKLGDRLLFKFTTLGVYDPDHSEAEDNGYVFIGWGNYRNVIVSGETEEAALEHFRLKLNDDSEEYNGSHWDMELVGIDLRPTDADPYLSLDPLRD